MMLCIAKQIFVMNIESKQMKYMNSLVYKENVTRKTVYFVGSQ